MGVQVVSSQGQSSGVKTDGAFLPRILLSGFLLVSVVGDSAFLGLQTLVRRGTGPFYSAPSAAALRCHHSRCAGLWCCAGGPCRSSEPVYSAPRAAAPRCRQNRCAGHKSHAGHPCVSSTGGSPAPWATRICLKVWRPLVLRAFPESCNPGMLAIGHLGSFSIFLILIYCCLFGVL